MQHRITRKEAVNLVDKLVTLRLDIWKAHMVSQLAGQVVDQYNTPIKVCVELEVDSLAVLFAIDGGI